MDAALSYHVLDVFTDRPFAGNPLAVVTGAGALTAAQMQALAREFNLSETVFVTATGDGGLTARLRIFTPGRELPFAGHPVLGAAVLIAEQARGSGDWTAEMRLDVPAGRVPVRLSRTGGVTRGRFTAPLLPAPLPGEVPPSLAAEALGLPAGAIGFGSHRPGAWQAGPGFAFVPLRDRAALARAAPREPAFGRLTAAAGAVIGACLYAPAEEAGADFAARLFAPAAGVPEDPATGSAAATLAGPLVAAGALAEGRSSFVILQGVEMGRPSRLELEAEVADGRLSSVRVGGAAVRVAGGRITLPPP